MLLEFESEEQLNRYPVEEVVWGKENDIVGHEFLVFKIRGDFFLDIERSTGHEEIKTIIDSEDPVGTLFGAGLNVRLLLLVYTTYYFSAIGLIGRYYRKTTRRTGGQTGTRRKVHVDERTTKSVIV